MESMHLRYCTEYKGPRVGLRKLSFPKLLPYGGYLYCHLNDTEVLAIRRSFWFPRSLTLYVLRDKIK